MNSTLKWIWLAEKCGAGSTELLRLVEKLGSINDIFEPDYDCTYTHVDVGISLILSEDGA